MGAIYSSLEFKLLNDWQRDFPLERRPFRAMAAKVGVSEATVLAMLTGLSAQGAVSRVGAVLAPSCIGVSTLAALAVPEESIDEIAARVSARPEVNHNYRREHKWNLWFVVTRPDAVSLDAALADIERDTGCSLICMPMEREYHIDLGFDLQTTSKTRDTKVKRIERPRLELDDYDKALLVALQPGLELVSRPFKRLAERTKNNGLDEDTVIARLIACLDYGIIKRLGVIVRHHELGFRANAMVVFDLSDSAVDAYGEALARDPAVTLCYRRKRNMPNWPFNLYCMVHGRSRAEVEPAIARLSEIVGHKGLPLFSTRRYKQCGARYFDNA